MTAYFTYQEGTEMPTYATPEPISATIELVVGDVHISAGDRDATVVDVRPSDPSAADDVKAAELTRVEYADEQLLITVPKLRSWMNRKGASVDVTIELPAGSRIHGTAGLAHFRCEGRLGDCQIKTGLGRIWVEQAETLNLRSGLGDISVEQVTGRTEVTTGSGDVRLRELEGSAVIKNANGNTWIGVARSHVRLKAANGDIDIESAHADVVAKSARGDVRLGEAVRGSVVVETKIGDLEVGIREGTAAWLDVSSGVGQVHNALDRTEAPEAPAETVEVRGRTSGGDIVIRRASGAPQLSSLGSSRSAR